MIPVAVEATAMATATATAMNKKTGHNAHNNGVIMIKLDQKITINGNDYYAIEDLDLDHVTSDKMFESMVGKYVLVRTINEGINFGIVGACDQSGVLLIDARRLWYHAPQNKITSWYEGVAEHGLSDDSKASCPRTKLIVENYSLTFCTEKAVKSIISHPVHQQS